MKLRNLILFTLTIITYSLSLSQSSDYIINIENDTIFGKVKTPKSRFISNTISFKETGSKEWESYSASDLKAFRANKIYAFKSKEIIYKNESTQGFVNTIYSGGSDLLKFYHPEAKKKSFYIIENGEKTINCNDYFILDTIKEKVTEAPAYRKYLNIELQRQSGLKDHKHNDASMLWVVKSFDQDSCNIKGDKFRSFAKFRKHRISFFTEMAFITRDDQPNVLFQQGFGFLAELTYFESFNKRLFIELSTSIAPLFFTSTTINNELDNLYNKYISNEVEQNIFQTNMYNSVMTGLGMDWKCRNYDIVIGFSIGAIRRSANLENGDYYIWNGYVYHPYAGIQYNRFKLSAGLKIENIDYGLSVKHFPFTRLSFMLN